ncbi:MAG: DUF4003 family protein [Myxococcota bacterium]
MPFREPEDKRASQGIEQDPFDRFAELYAAFDADRGMLGDRMPLRYAAVTMLASPHPAAELAATVRAQDKQLADNLGWFSNIGGSIRIMIAALLVKSGDSAPAFLAEAQRVQTLFRAAKIRRGSIYEVIAILVMRIRSGAPIRDEDVDRFKAIYEELKRYHWFLTGPDDFPACAILVGQPGTPEVIGAKIEAIYRALHKHSDLWRGESLQTAANILYLSGLEPMEIAERFRKITEAFRAAGVRIGQAEYDEVAILCFLARPVEGIVKSVVDGRDRMRANLKGVTKSMAFSLGTSIAFVRLVAGHENLGPLADAKVLIDMQAIIAARQAAMAAAAATGSASV